MCQQSNYCTKLFRIILHFYFHTLNNSLVLFITSVWLQWLSGPLGDKNLLDLVFQVLNRFSAESGRKKICHRVRGDFFKGVGFLWGSAGVNVCQRVQLWSNMAFPLPSPPACICFLSPVSSWWTIQYRNTPEGSLCLTCRSSRVSGVESEDPSTSWWHKAFVGVFFSPSERSMCFTGGQ